MKSASQALPGIPGQAILPPAAVEPLAFEAPGGTEAILVSLGLLNSANDLPFAQLCRPCESYYPAAFPNLGHIHGNTPFLGAPEGWRCVARIRY